MIHGNEWLFQNKPICIPEASENSWAETTKKVNISKKH